jgi:hypothetical protein
MWKGAVVDLEPRRTCGRGLRDRREFLRTKRSEIREDFLGSKKMEVPGLERQKMLILEVEKNAAALFLESKAGTHQ